MPIYNSMEEFLADESTDIQTNGGYTEDDLLRTRRWDPSNDGSFVGDIARGLFVRGAIGMGDMAIGLADTVYNAATGDSLHDKAEELGWHSDKWLRKSQAQDSFDVQEGRNAVDRADGFFETIGAYASHPKYAAVALAEQIPQLIPTIGAAGKAAKLAQAAGLGPKGIRRAAIATGAAMEGALTTGSVGAAIGEEYVNQGITDDRRLAGAALGAGAGTALIGAAMGPLGGAVEASIGSRLAQRAINKRAAEAAAKTQAIPTSVDDVAFGNVMGKTALQRGLKSGLGEGVEEMLQSGQEQMWQNYGTGNPLTEDLGKSMGTGLVLGGAMGTALHPFTGPSSKEQRNILSDSNPTATQSKNARQAINNERSAMQAQAEQQALAQEAAIAQMQAQQQAIATEPTMATQPVEQQPVQEAPVETTEQPQPKDIVQVLRQDLHYNDIGLRDLVVRPVSRTGNKEQQFRIHEVYRDLSPAQQQFVRAYLASTKQAGALNRSTFVDTFADAVDTAMESVDDDPNVTYQALNDIPPLASKKKADKLRNKVVASVMNIYMPDASATAPAEQVIDERIAQTATTPLAPETQEPAAKQEAIPTTTPAQVQPVQQVEQPPVETQVTEPKPVVAPTASTTAVPNEYDYNRMDELEQEFMRAAMRDPAIVTKKTAQTQTRAKATQEVKDDANATVERARSRRKNLMQFEQKPSFSRSTRVKDEKNPYTEKVSQRTYEPEEEKELKDTLKRYKKTDKNTAATAGASQKISDEDIVLGNDVRRIVLDYLDDKYEGDIRKSLQSIYAGLSAKSLRAVHKHAADRFKRSYRGKATPLSKRWFVNVLDDMVTAKEAGETFIVPEPSDAVKSNYSDIQRFSNLGLPSDFMSSAEDTTVETFDLSDNEVNTPHTPTVDDIRAYGVGYQQAIRLKRRLDNTLNLIRDRKYRVMVSADADSNFGSTDKSDVAHSLIRISKANKSGGIQKDEGWKAIQHLNGTDVTPKEEVAIVIKTFNKMLERYKKATGESSGSSAVPDSLKDNFKTVVDGVTKETDEKGNETETLGGMRITSKRQEAVYGNDSPFGKHYDNALDRFTKHSKAFKIETNQYLADLMELFPLMFRNHLKGVELTANHPVRKFLRASTSKDKFSYVKDDDSGEMTIKGPDKLNASEHLIHGFMGSGMYTYLRDQKGVSQAEISDVLNTTVSDDSQAITNAWRDATRELGGFIAGLNRTEAQKAYLVKQLTNYVEGKVLPSIEITDDTPTTDREIADDKYETLMIEQRVKLLKTFKNTLRAKVVFSDRVPQQWQDKSSKDAMSSKGGKGLATSTSKEALALREQFKGDVVMPAFKEEFGGKQVKDVPLMDRVDFYENLVSDPFMMLTWEKPGETGDAAKYPKGVFRIQQTDDLPDTQTVLDGFRPEDLMMDQWVKASGLFTDEELRNSLNLARKGKEAETGDVGSKYFGDLITQATNSYAKRIKVESEYGLAQQAGLEASLAKDETLEASQMKPLRDAYDKQVTLFREFMANEANTSDKRVETRWDELISLIDSRALAAVRADIFADAAIDGKEFTEDAKRALDAVKQLTKDIKTVSVQMLNRTDWGEKRALYKEGLAKRIAELSNAYEDLHVNEHIKRIFAERAQMLEADRKLSNELRTELNQDFRDDIDYVVDNMRTMTMDDIDALYDNGTDEEVEVLDAAGKIVANITKHNTFWDASPTSNTRGALLTLSSSISDILDSQAVADNPKLFLDSLAAYLRFEQSGFGEMLNEFARELFNRQCTQLVKRGFKPGKDNTAYWEAVDAAREANVALQESEGDADAWQTFRDAVAEKERLYNEALEAEAEKTFEKEVYKDSKHALRRGAMVAVHREAKRLSVFASDPTFQELPNADKDRLISAIKKDLRASLPSFSRSKQQAKPYDEEAMLEQTRAAKGYTLDQILSPAKMSKLLGDNNGQGNTLRPSLEGLGQENTQGKVEGLRGVSSDQGRTYASRHKQLHQVRVRPRSGSLPERSGFHGLLSENEVDPTIAFAVRKLRTTLASIAGQDRADNLLRMFEFKDLNAVKAAPSDANGAYFDLDGKPTLLLRSRVRDLNRVVAHEFAHFLFNDVYTQPAMRMEIVDGKVKPVGSVARELLDLAKADKTFGDLVSDYPLGFNINDPLEIQKELLAQAGAMWIADKSFRGTAKAKAPMLSKIINDRLLGDTNGKGKPVRPSVEGLGQKDTEGKARSSRGVSSDQSNTNRTRLSQLSNQDTAGPRSGSVVQGQRAGVVHAGEKEINQSADRVPLLKKVATAVRNALPTQYREMADKAASAARGFFDQHLGEAFLGALFTSDLARLVSKVMPSVDKYLQLSKRRDAWINARQHDLSGYMNRFNELPKEAQDALNDLLASTTLEGVWIEKPSWMKDEAWETHRKENVETRNDLRRSYDALPPEAQRLYNEVLEHGYQSQLLRRELMKTKLSEYKKILDDASIPEEEKKELKESFDFTLAAAQDDTRLFVKPYAPLLREGSHAVVARSEELTNAETRLSELRQKRREEGLSLDEDVEVQELNDRINELKQSPSDYVVVFVDGQAKANLLRDEMQKGFNGSVEAFPRDVATQRMAVNLETIKSLEDQLVKRLNNEEDREQARKELRHMVKVLNEMHALNLSQYHAGKNRLRRMKVAGFDRNMMNSFVTNGYRESLFYGNVKFQSDMAEAMREMRKESNETTKEVPREKRKRIYNEILKREELNYDYKPSEAVARAQRVTSVFMLMTSPAFYLQNLTQSFMMTAPYITKRYPASEAFQGIFDNTRRMMEAYFDKRYRNGVEINFSKLPWMTDELLQGLREARAMGLIDIGISQDFGNLMSQNKFTTITDYLSRGARVVEMVNRVGAFTTAFNLRYEEAVKDGVKDPVKAATDYACDVVRETHGDYSATNEPRFFRKGGLGLGVEKLIFQFRKFQLIQIGFMTRLAKDAFANSDSVTRSAARRALAWTMGTHFTMTGLKGTPLVATLAFILNGIFGDDDDTEEDTLRKFIGDKATSDLLIRGLPAYLGVDVSERIGAANMFSPFPYLNATPLSGREGANETLVAMMGPTASQIVRGFSGLSYMAEGDLFKGVEMMLPNGLTNAMRAYRYATEGYTTKNGTVTIPPEEFSTVEAFFQGLGLQTTLMSDRYRLQDKLMRTQDRFSREETRLNKAYRNAKTPAERLAVQREYVTLQKERAKAGFKPKPVTQLVKNAQRVEKDARNAVGGIISNNTNREFLTYWAEI